MAEERRQYPKSEQTLEKGECSLTPHQLNLIIKQCIKKGKGFEGDLEVGFLIRLYCPTYPTINWPDL